MPVCAYRPSPKKRAESLIQTHVAKDQDQLYAARDGLERLGYECYGYVDSQEHHATINEGMECLTAAYRKAKKVCNLRNIYKYLCLELKSEGETDLVSALNPMLVRFLDEFPGEKLPAHARKCICKKQHHLEANYYIARSDDYESLIVIGSTCILKTRTCPMCLHPFDASTELGKLLECYGDWNPNANCSECSKRRKRLVAAERNKLYLEETRVRQSIEVEQELGAAAMYQTITDVRGLVDLEHAEFDEREDIEMERECEATTIYRDFAHEKRIIKLKRMAGHRSGARVQATPVYQKSVDAGAGNEAATKCGTGIATGKVMDADEETDSWLPRKVVKEGT
jgi:hypothetical protein